MRRVAPLFKYVGLDLILHKGYGWCQGHWEQDKEKELRKQGFLSRNTPKSTSASTLFGSNSAV
jgi:hypothetical protein